MKKKILEKIHDFRLIVIAVILLVMTLIIWDSFVNKSKIIGVLSLVSTLIFIKELFRIKFKNKNSYGLLYYDDTLLERAFIYGDFIVLLPGYSLLQEESKSKLDSEIQSFSIDKIECYLSPDDGAMVIAEKVVLNYRLERDSSSLYRFITEAPENWKTELSDNFSGDFARGFNNNIVDNDEAQNFKDFKFIEDSFFWMINQNETEKIDDLDTTVNKMCYYGLIPINITVGSYQFPKETDAAKAQKQAEKIENEIKQERVDAYQKRLAKAKINNLIPLSLMTEEDCKKKVKGAEEDSVELYNKALVIALKEAKKNGATQDQIKEVTDKATQDLKIFEGQITETIISNKGDGPAAVPVHTVAAASGAGGKK